MRTSAKQKPNKSQHLLTATLVVAAFVAIAPAGDATARQQTIFVNRAATGQNDGTSWEHVFTTLQDAIAASSPGNVLWVAAGTYRPDEGLNQTAGDRVATFLISHDLTLYGGFAGTETSLEERDIEANETILSGDLLGNDGDVFDPTNPLRDDNSAHVVVLARADEQSFEVVMDGFTIQAGHAGEDQLKLTDFHEDIIGEYGGGLYITRRAVSRIYNATFTSNYAMSCGGGVFSSGLATVHDSMFNTNGAGTLDLHQCISGFGTGGGLAVAGDYLSHDLLLIVSNTEFINNNGGDGCGGAVSISFANAMITHSKFEKNRALDGWSICISSRERFVTMNSLQVTDNRGISHVQRGSVASAAIFMDNGSSALIYGSLITQNGSSDVPTFGGAVLIQRSSRLQVVNSTIANNVADPGRGDGMRVDRTSTVVFQNSILDDDSVVMGNVRPPDAGVKTFMSEYSILNGELPEFTALGAGIQQGVDPLFDENYRLLPGSPAVDAGANAIVPPDFFDVDMDGDTSEPVPLDLAGNPRFVMQEGSAPNRTVDLGPYEMSFTATSIDHAHPGKESAPCGLTAAYPNPAYHELTVDVSAPGQLEIVDMLGRNVGGWHASRPGVSIHEVSTLPGGSYFLRFTAAGSESACLRPFVIGS